MGLARFAGPVPAIPRGVPQHRRHLGRCGSSSPSRGRARGGSKGRTVRASGPGGRGWLGKGAQAPGGAGFSIRRIHELATEGARATRIGVSASHPRDLHRSTSLLVACAARADLALTRGHSVGVTTARSGHVAGDGIRRGLNLPGHTSSTRFDGHPGCARGSSWSQTRRSGPRKRVAFDGVASGDGPGTSSLGGESNPVNPTAGSATEGVRGRVTTLAPGRQSQEEGALLGGLEITGPQGRAA